jgi:NADH dehydrogenase
MSQPTRLLILGGGFGGLYTALTLEKLLKSEIRRGEVQLGLVSRESYIVFQPMLPEVISRSIGGST